MYSDDDEYEEVNYFESNDWDDEDGGYCDMQRNLGVNCSECPNAPECF